MMGSLFDHVMTNPPSSNHVANEYRESLPTSGPLDRTSRIEKTTTSSGSVHAS